MKADTVVIGAGFAGLAAADALIRRGATSVVVVEREPLPGQHASSQNAGMIRQAGVPDDIQSVLVPSGQALKTLLAPYPNAWMECGSLLLVDGRDRAKLDGFQASSRALGLPVERWTKEQAIRRVPILAQAQFEEALWSPRDAVVDIHRALQVLLDRLKDANTAVVLDCPVTGFQKKGDRITIVDTAQGPIDVERVVNASGAWAGSVGQLAGGVPIPFQPLRRHLMFSSHLTWVDGDWPFVWDISHEYYFRPETGGLLVSPCDEAAVSPGTPHIDPHVFEGLAERLQRYCPALAGINQERAWAGLRTFSPDRKFVIGQDLNVKNFFWLSGLGGHGVTGCLKLGELLAQAVMGPDGQAALAPWSPNRFS